jgi:hypothetical protein
MSYPAISRLLRQPVPQARLDKVQRNFERRKVATGTCGRASGTPCSHEHSCLTEMILMAAPGRVGSQCSPKVTGKNLGLLCSSACRGSQRLLSPGGCGIARRSC